MMEDKIRVLIVDDFELSRVGLGFMLKNIPFIESVEAVKNSKELFQLVKVNEPDVVFMDVQLEDESGIDIASQLLNKYPHTFVIAISSSKDIEDFTEMMDVGAAGFLLKKVTQEELEKAIREVLKGNMYFSKEFLSVAKKILPKQRKKSITRLSDREKEVLKLICTGHSNQEIAENLELSSHTIDAHRKKLLSKTGAKNTASMIMISIKDGLIDFN